MEDYLKIKDAELDTLKDENSKFLYCSNGTKRILVDNDININGLKIRYRKSYIEVTQNISVNGKRLSSNVSRFILNFSDKNSIVDHINRNPLDNRRCNLRVGTQSQNLANRACYSNKTEYKGISSQKGSIIRVQCQKDCVRFTATLSNKTIKQAAEVYDILALKLYGEFASLNFDKSLYTHEKISLVESNILEFKKIKLRNSVLKKYHYIIVPTEDSLPELDGEYFILASTVNGLIINDVVLFNNNKWVVPKYAVFEPKDIYAWLFKELIPQ